MSSIYKRSGRLWARVKDETGAWVSRKTPYKVGEEEKARRYVRKMAEVLEARRKGEAPAGPLTVAEYARTWVMNRKALGLRSAPDDEARLKNHVLPSIGALRMEEVRPRHIRDLVLAMRAKDELAPRTIRHVYGTLATMFRTAVADEVIIATPCVLPRGVLPKNKDRDPEWRATAIFAREEIETLTSDGRLLPDRRVLNALKSLAALRHSEAAGLRWRQIDLSLEPLAAINLGKTKTQVPRRVLVHSVLAVILFDWKQRGYAELFGDPPTDDDLVVPTRNGTVRQAAEAQEGFLADLATLGLRRRRGHDLRRSFISLALVDGARRDLLEVVTHGPRGDIISMYSTFPWPALCAEVEKLRIRYAPDASLLATSLATTPITSRIYKEKPATPTGFEPVLPA